MKLVIALLLLGAFSIQAAAPPFIVSLPRLADATNIEPVTEVNYFLDRDFLPEEFTISLKTYLANIYDEKDRFVFDGTCQMKFKYNGEVNRQKKLTLHAKNLTGITFTLFEVVGSKEVKKEITVPTFDSKTDKVMMELKTETFNPSNTYILRSTYKGHMEDDMHGFYRSQYEDDQGNKKLDFLII